eukprot:2945080-Rhodomonas_salina.1
MRGRRRDGDEDRLTCMLCTHFASTLTSIALEPLAGVKVRKRPQRDSSPSCLSLPILTSC